MNTIDVQALEVRSRLGELLEQVHYQAAQFRIKRKDKTMARLVNEPFMVAIDQLIENDPGLADTLALMLNQDVRQAIEQSSEDLKGGRVRELKAGDGL